ncbi:MAG: ABC transporter ATP-binding protein [Phycisphaerales bacterium]|nr:MAG: ABC transporter ATP-binding protein [Phycisphaerales bacterium]
MAENKTKQSGPESVQNEAGPALDVQGLSFSYSGGSRVLDGLGLTLGRGEQMVLKASSGAGKSTLLHLIAGLLEPGSGRVLIDGTEIHRLKGAKRDRFRGSRIGMIFQTFNLLDGFSALENVTTAMMFSKIPKAEHDERARALLKRLGIDRHQAPPQSLSVGQQQRVAVARAMACRPSLVLADEPTASLDPENAAEAVKLIREVCAEEGAALLLVSHDPAVAIGFERVEELAAAPAGTGS